ncbi:helix-turn-helix domain-containing protein [Macrococcus capreoli]|uniref:helix-turn-helix domain-containing protein n=1 Tax=Macrococcus capreoli TaxID=2982690 RepID=UPI003EE47938
MEKIALNIKYYRILRGLSQKELSNNICNISTLHRIEKGKQIPRLELISLLAKKLNIPIEWILTDEKVEDFETLKKYEKICSDLSYNRDFCALNEVLKDFEVFLLNSSMKNYNDNYYLKFLLWQKSIVLHELHKNSTAAINLIKKYITCKIHQEIDLSILNTYSIILLDMKNYQDSISILERAINSIKRFPYINDNNIIIKLKYNLAYSFYYVDNYNQSITAIQDAIELLELNHSYFMLGKSYHLLANIYCKLENLEEAKYFFEKALSVFIIENENEYYEKTSKQLDNLLNNYKFNNH